MKAIILAGGKGTRLRPYTEILPKPLLPINGRPLIKVVIKRLKDQGIDEITLLTNYKAEYFHLLLGDGSELGVNLDYITEKDFLGTAGPLKNLEGKAEEDFLLMNGDVLTDLDFRKLFRFHRKEGSLITVVTKKENIKLNYGLVETNGKRVIGWQEKPVLEKDISAGIYAINPSTLVYIKKGERIDMPDLVKRLIEDRKKVVVFPYTGRWIDIGRVEDFQRAQREELSQFDK